jgi:thioredoxin-like negative regulator of GroEL
MNKKYIYVLCVISLHVFSLIGRVRTIQNERDFEKQLQRAQVLVALVYEGKEKNISQFLRMYESVSSQRIYDDADVTFVKLNNNTANNRLITQAYSVKTFPSCILFINGQAVKSSNGAIVILTGSVSAQELNMFIHQYCNTIIQNAIIEKKQRKAERIREAQDEANPYFYPSTYYSNSTIDDLSSWKKPTRSIPE